MSIHKTVKLRILEQVFEGKLVEDQKQTEMDSSKSRYCMVEFDEPVTIVAGRDSPLEMLHDGEWIAVSPESPTENTTSIAFSFPVSE